MSCTQEEMMQNLLSMAKSETNSEILAELLQIAGSERMDELAEVLVDFCQNHGILNEVMRIAIRKEISETVQETTLFREDSFAIKLVNRVLFGDLGRKYLTKLILPLIQEIRKLPKEIDVRRDGQNSEFLKDNISITVRLLDQFLTNFASSPKYCPISFREVFGTIQECVEEKFGEKNSPPFVLDFIFFKFMCPSLISPSRYQLVDEDDLTTLHKKNLLQVSKILNLLAHNVYEKFEGPEYEELVSFVKSKHSFLVDHLEKLLDLNDVAKCKEIVASSRDVTVSLDEMLRSQDEFTKFIGSLNHPVNNPENNLSSKNLGQAKLKFEQLLACTQENNWKMVKSKGGADLFISKDKSTNLVKTKISLHVKIAITQLFNVIKSPEIWRLLNATDSFDIETLTDSNEFRALWKLPFPISNRDIIFSHWEHNTETECALIFDDVISLQIPRKKGFIRAKALTCGILLESTSENTTKMTLLWHVDPKGCVPAWIGNQVGSILISRFSKLKKSLETTLGQ